MDDFRKVPQQHAELTRALEKVYAKSFTDEKRKEVSKFSQAWQEYLIGVSAELFAQCKAMIAKQKEENEVMAYFHSETLKRQAEQNEHMDALERRLAARIEDLWEYLDGRGIYGE